ncbi:MAG: TatD family hydrolase [Acidobacteria bacterium]|nr:TatD family hydrolase [Acidobacteriota bacterium]
MFVDSHTHLDQEQFDGDRDEVLARARAAGVQWMLVVGSAAPQGDSLEHSLRLANAHDGVYASAGLHPHDACHAGPDVYQRIRDHCAREKVVAVGEIGLDYHYDFSPRVDQLRAFEEQLELAAAMRLPVIVHSREAEEDTVALLKAGAEGVRSAGVMHCFTGGARFAEQCLALGLMISLSGIITFPKTESLREAACAVPLDRLLVETDCPFLAPVPHRGKRNEPAYVLEVVRTVAALKGVSPEEIGEWTLRNFRGLFLKPATGEAR